jgi:hypothetical protein
MKADDCLKTCSRCGLAIVSKQPLWIRLTAPAYACSFCGTREGLVDRTSSAGVPEPSRTVEPRSILLVDAAYDFGKFPRYALQNRSSSHSTLESLYLPAGAVCEITSCSLQSFSLLIRMQRLLLRNQFIDKFFNLVECERVGNRCRYSLVTIDPGVDLLALVAHCDSH